MPITILACATAAVEKNDAARITPAIRRVREIIAGKTARARAR